MPTAMACKCCQTTNIVDGKTETEGIDCITEHECFQVNCLNTQLTETSYYVHIIQNGPLQEAKIIHECVYVLHILKKQSYCQIPYMNK